MSIDQMMATIKSICPNAAIEFRTWHIQGATKWYLSTPRLEVCESGMLGSVNSDGVDPLCAVEACYVSLTDQTKVFKRNNKTYHRWVGFMFEEVEAPQ